MPDGPGQTWLPLAEASPRLGIRPDSLRKQIKRGRCPWQARQDNMGKWSVLVPAAAAPIRTDSRTDAPDAELVAALRARIDSLERRLDAAQAERDRLLALLERRRWPGLWPALRRFWSGEQR